MTNRTLTAAFALIATFGLAHAAQATSGRTADGCTYRIINGQYLTSCDEPKAAPAASAPVEAPVLSYESVPMRANTLASPPPPTASTAVAPPAQDSIAEEVYETRRPKERNKLVDTTYVGAQVGSTSISKAGSGTGVGVMVGSFFDDHFGFELGYSYTKQNLALGLESRGAGPVNTYSPNDAVLKAHLISGEVQGYLTDTFNQLRPYLGLGLGFKSSSLNETPRGNRYGGEWGISSGAAASSGSSLTQSSLGGLGSAGAKFRIGRAFQLGFSFRYFFPLARQESRLEQPLYSENARLTKADDALTGASQYQLLGGLQYAF
jgi:opacity protein-like surface antigen